MAAPLLKNCKIYFWDLEGTVEPVRIMLSLRNIPFEEVVMNKDTWPAVKKSGKPAFEQLPLLELVPSADNGLKEPVYITQTVAMTTYVGRLLGFHPSDPFE